MVGPWKLLTFLLTIKQVSGSEDCPAVQWSETDNLVWLSCPDDPDRTRIPEYHSENNTIVTVADFTNNTNLSLDNDTILTQMGYKDVTMLRLGECNIIKIFKNNFKDLYKLNDLDLNSNSIHYIEFESFNGLTELKTLNLSNNNLIIIQYRILIAMINLESIDLSNNKLQQLSIPGLSHNKTVYRTLTKLNEIRLKGNPWKCNCHLGRLHQDLKERRLLTEEPRCSDPRQPSWNELKPSDFTCLPYALWITSTKKVDIGDDISLECRFGGNPLPTLYWTMTDGRRINSVGNSSRHIIENEVKENEYEKFQKSVLKYKITKPKDIAPVTCVADNGKGVQIKRTVDITRIQTMSNSSVIPILGISFLGTLIGVLSCSLINLIIDEIEAVNGGQ